MEDQRPAPKDRKHTQLWQTYLWWSEFVEMRKKHNLRISSIEKGKSNMDLDIEINMMNNFGIPNVPLQTKLKKRNRSMLDMLVNPITKFEKELSVWQQMVDFGMRVGPIWEWLLNIKGVGESIAAQLLAQVDDIEKFSSVRKLQRFCGYGVYGYWLEKGKPVAPLDGWKWAGSGNNKRKQWTVILPDHRISTYNNYPGQVDNSYIFLDPEDNWNKQVKHTLPKDGWELKAHRDVNIKAYHSPYNRLLKSLLWNYSESFIKQQTSVYTDIYYSEKARQRELHPEPIQVNGHKKFTDGHIEFRGRRKMSKLFLRDFWVAWREFEGLPVSNPDEYKRY